MPTYAYACTECEHEFDAQQSFSDASLTACPSCEGRLRKKFGAVGVVFKGSGFYRNDSRTGSGSSSGTPGDKGSSETKPSGTDKAAGSDKAAASSSGGSSSGSGDKAVASSGSGSSTGSSTGSKGTSAA